MLIMPHCNYCTAEIIFHGKLLQDFNEVSGTPGNGRLDVARNAWLILKMPLECDSLIQNWIETKEKEKHSSCSNSIIAFDMINHLI